ncbi:MAG TPA: hypothetical protein VJY54_13745 [Lachnospiraceae bacterium]|nr:hypothetical protein [Lachnospiraceae bacterium]
MAAYDMLMRLVQDYYIDLGYNNLFVENYFSNQTFKEMISIRLANANVMIKNKTDRSSHQTHIAITGEAIGFFYNDLEFIQMDNKRVDKKKIFITESNIQYLMGKQVDIADVKMLERMMGYVTLGKRTQRQVQLSKRNSENSECFNTLRLGLYENDLLIMLKYRNEEGVLAVGIPQTFYLDYIPNYASKYETNTYLRIPK